MGTSPPVPQGGASLSTPRPAYRASESSGCMSLNPQGWEEAVGRRSMTPSVGGLSPYLGGDAHQRALPENSASRPVGWPTVSHGGWRYHRPVGRSSCGRLAATPPKTPEQAPHSLAMARAVLARSPPHRGSRPPCALARHSPIGGSAHSTLPVSQDPTPGGTGVARYGRPTRGLTSPSSRSHPGAVFAGIYLQPPSLYCENIPTATHIHPF